MFGEPPDVRGECNARLEISDNFGDNHGTLRCPLEPGHPGPHLVEFQREETPVVITWYVDESRCEPCEGVGREKDCYQLDAPECPECRGTGRKLPRLKETTR